MDGKARWARSSQASVRLCAASMTYERPKNDNAVTWSVSTLRLLQFVREFVNLFRGVITGL